MAEKSGRNESTDELRRKQPVRASVWDATCAAGIMNWIFLRNFRDHFENEQFPGWQPQRRSAR